MKFNNKKIVSLSIILYIATGMLLAQVEGKREMRATWVASVSHIDWPAYEDRGNPANQKADLISKLELYQASGLNAIFLQVRPECDALYNSTYEPWSRYLTGFQGTDPGYDPLQFAIDEAHKRGIEVHAWMNPYRLSASTSPGPTYFHSTHVYKEHPEWAMEYPSGRLILNPGIPDVMSYIGSVVYDICSNYNIDGVHFDDYFYAYEGTDASLDATEFSLYGAGMDLDDWRRDNVNRMVDTVYQNIQKANPDVRFGVSPFGIYGINNPPGINGLNAYAVIYCDPIAWLEDQSVDYITPQLYWPTGGSQDFETLANFWADSVKKYDRHLYTGHGSYRLGANPDQKKSTQAHLHEYKMYVDKYYSEEGKLLDLSMMETDAKKGTGDPVSEWTLSEIGRQIDIVRSRSEDGGLGGVYFSASDFERINGFAEYLSQNKYTHPAIIPEMTWKADPTPSYPVNLRTEEIEGDHYLLWDYSGSPNDRFVVYSSGSESDSSLIIINPDNIKSLVFSNSIALSDLDYSINSNIVVTSVSAAGKESLASSVFVIDVGDLMVTLLSPEDQAILTQTDNLLWQGAQSGLNYKLQVSKNSSFSNLSYESDWIPQESVSLTQLNLEGETPYFWRVKAKNELEGPWTAHRGFITGFPAAPELIYPENLDQMVSTQPRVRWSASEIADEIIVEISESSNFAVLTANETFPAGETNGKLVTTLELSTWYYIRIKAINSSGQSFYTDLTSFKTSAGEIPEVTLFQPENQANLASFDKLQWESTVTGATVSYKIEVALDSDFSIIMSASNWITDMEVDASLLNLEGQRQYFWRVKGKNENGEGEFSNIREFFAAYPPRPALTSPAHLSSGINVRPELAWNADPVADSMYVEFSEDGNFNLIEFKESFSATNFPVTINGKLNEFTWYYARGAAKNEFGYSIFSPSRYFETGQDTQIREFENTSEFLSIYPNPVADTEFTIKIKNTSTSNPILSIYDVYGRKILSFNTGKENSVKLSSDIFSQKGLYLIRILDGKNEYVKRIIVTK